MGKLKYSVAIGLICVAAIIDSGTNSPISATGGTSYSAFQINDIPYYLQNDYSSRSEGHTRGRCQRPRLR
jgi:hypothetical protein